MSVTAQIALNISNDDSAFFFVGKWSKKKTLMILSKIRYLPCGRVSHLRKSYSSATLL
jgi:hypothetical protein